MWLRLISVSLFMLFSGPSNDFDLKELGAGVLL